VLVLPIILFGIYLGTVCPIVYPGDSGELTAASFSLGIPHNSGYPLFGLLGKLFCLIPIGNVAFRMNIMSVCFGVAALWLVYSLIHKMTDSKMGATIGTSILAFTSVLWSQTASAEVYTLHVFCVALLLRLLWWWDEKREFYILALFVFITGLSFTNHMQTVMLAPGVLFIILSREKSSLLNVKHFFIFSFFFILALSLYLYLPIRTEAGAAIAWGEPNNLERFFAHVSGRSHRGSYVLNRAPLDYLQRAGEALLYLGSQFGFVLLLSLWGWLTLRARRWKIFFILLVIFDFVYTIFLNIISLQITAFLLPSSIGMAILSGNGILNIWKRVESIAKVGPGTLWWIKGSCLLIPGIFFFFNYSRCNQSQNYTAYEHAINIFRTTQAGDILLMSGDNNVFPIVYGRIVERMEEDVTLYVRNNNIFKWLREESEGQPNPDSWRERRNRAEMRMIEEKGDRNVLYAVFGTSQIALPDQYHFLPFGVLYRVVQENDHVATDTVARVWRYYSSESFYGNFERDFMTREVCAYFHFNNGKFLLLSGQRNSGLKSMNLASRIGYDDQLIHNDMAIFLIDRGLFEEGRFELEKALLYHEDISGVYNNWGYYYSKIGDYDNAVSSFQKALDLKPTDVGYHNNLGFALYELGRYEESLITLHRSLSINSDQPAIGEFIEKSLSSFDSGKKQ